MQVPASVTNPMEIDEDPRQTGAAGRKRGPMKFAYASGTRPLDGYTIKRGVGAGGFGEVYYATSDAGKEVALKRIQRNLDVELRGVSQCLNLKHANLVSLYDIRYDDDEQAWVVMEYVSGESLQQVIERQPQGMPAAEVERWFLGIAHGVAYLHDHGIVHRDLKPGNIFLDQGVVKIGDYGLSKFISCSRRSGQTESVGTFHYMAPEIGLGRYGKEIDIYALGILLYEMLSGRVPFEGESSQEIIMKHLTAQPDLARIPPRYRVVIAQAMAKDPGSRYSNVAQMVQALGLSWSGTAGSAPPVTAGNLHAGAAGAAAAHTQPPQVPPRQPPWGAAPHPPQGAAAASGGGARAQDARQHHAAAARPAAILRREEPIAALLRARGTALRTWWRQQTPSGRAGFGILAVVVLFYNAAWIVPLLFPACMVYACYYLFWSLVVGVWGVGADLPPPLPTGAAGPTAPLSPGGVHAAPVMAQAAPAHAAPSPRRTVRTVSRQQLEDGLRERLRAKTRMQRWKELTGSLLLAAVVAAVVAAPLAFLGVPQVSGHAQELSRVFAWIFTTSSLASWSLLTLGKGWEGADDDPWLRRFYLLLVGAGVGMIAGALAHYLMLSPYYLIGTWHEFSRSSLAAQVPDLYDAAGNPRVFAYSGYFAGVFLTLRWWLRTDPLRTHRLSIFATLVTIGFAAAWYMILPVPRGLLAIAATVIAAQMAAYWVPARKRELVKARLLAHGRTLN